MKPLHKPAEAGWQVAVLGAVVDRERGGGAGGCGRAFCCMVATAGKAGAAGEFKFFTKKKGGLVKLHKDRAGNLYQAAKPKWEGR